MKDPYKSSAVPYSFLSFRPSGGTSAAGSGFALAVGEAGWPVELVERPRDEAEGNGAQLRACIKYSTPFLSHEVSDRSIYLSEGACPRQ